MPVAVDVIVEGSRKDEEGEWFRTLNRHASGGEIGKFSMASGRIHGVTPGGTFLCGKHCWRDCDVRGALEEWNKLPAEDRKPAAVKVADLRGTDPKAPAPPAGTLMLKVHQRRLERDGQGALRRWKWHDFGEEPGHDTVWLDEASWRSLVPANAQKGQEFALPARVADRIFRPALVDTSGGGKTTPSARWEPGHVRSLEARVRVEEVTASHLVLLLRGSAVFSEEPGGRQSKGGAWLEAQVLGTLRYDLRKKAFDLFDVVALGDHLGYYLANPDRPTGGEPLTVLDRRVTVLGVSLQLAPCGQVVPPAGHASGE